MSESEVQLPALPAMEMPATALEAAQQIRAYHDIAVAFGAVLHAKTMERAWIIRRDHPGQQAFAAFVGEHLAGVLQPPDAWSMAETWEVARQNRQVRDLVRAEPARAIQFVRDFASAAADDQPMLELDACDRAVADVLAAPKRKQRAMLRELVQAREDGARSPDDVKRIDELERECAEAREEAAQAKGGTAALAGKLSATENALAELASLFEAAEPLSARQRDRVRRIADLAMGDLERILDRVAEPALEGEVL